MILEGDLREGCREVWEGFFVRKKNNSLLLSLQILLLINIYVLSGKFFQSY